MAETTGPPLALAAAQCYEARRLGSAPLGNDRGGCGSWAHHNGVELQKVEGSREERQDFSETSYEQSVTPVPGKD